MVTFIELAVFTEPEDLTVLDLHDTELDCISALEDEGIVRQVGELRDLPRAGLSFWNPLRVPGMK